MDWIESIRVNPAILGRTMLWLGMSLLVLILWASAARTEGSTVWQHRKRRLASCRAAFGIAFGGAILVGSYLLIPGLPGGPDLMVAGLVFTVLYLGALFEMRGGTKFNPCANCGKLIGADQDWNCGACERTNENRSLLSSCAHCGETPAAIECPFCRTVFSTSSEPARSNFVTRIAEPPKPGETAEQALTRRKLELEEREHRSRLLAMDTEIKSKERTIAELGAVPPDPLVEWKSKLVRELEVTQIKLTSLDALKRDELRLNREVDANSDLTDEEKVARKRFVQNQIHDLMERIRLGER